MAAVPPSSGSPGGSTTTQSAPAALDDWAVIHVQPHTGIEIEQLGDVWFVMVHAGGGGPLGFDLEGLRRLVGKATNLIVCSRTLDDMEAEAGIGARNVSIATSPQDHAAWKRLLVNWAPATPLFEIV